MNYSIEELARRLALPFRGRADLTLTGVSSWDEATESSVIFVESPARRDPPRKELTAGCVIASQRCLQEGWNAIISEAPKRDFAKAAALFSPRKSGSGQHHPTSVVNSSAILGQRVDVGPGTVIGAGVRIGEGSILHAGVVVGEGSVIGEQCILHPHVILYPGVILGNRVTLHASGVFGGDGFGYVFDGKEQIKFPQIGGLVIEDDVEGQPDRGWASPSVVHTRTMVGRPC